MSTLVCWLVVSMLGLQESRTHFWKEDVVMAKNEFHARLIHYKQWLQWLFSLGHSSA